MTLKTSVGWAGERSAKAGINLNWEFCYGLGWAWQQIDHKGGNSTFSLSETNWVHKYKKEVHKYNCYQKAINCWYNHDIGWKGNSNHISDDIETK